MPSANQLEDRLFKKNVPAVGFNKLGFSKRKRNLDPILLELPAILDWLALATANGLSIFESFSRLARIAEGEVARSLRVLCKELELGESLYQALENLRDASSSPSLHEFCNRLNLSMRRGTPLAAQLRAQADSARAQLRNQLLVKAGANEIKLLLPLVFLILPITVWFAVFPSLQLLQTGF